MMATLHEIASSSEPSETPERQGELSRRIAHSIRSPLGVIQGVLLELQRLEEDHNPGGDPQKQRLLDFAGRGTKQLERIAQRLSMFARLEREPVAHDSGCELQQLVKLATDDVVSVRPRKGIQVVHEEGDRKDVGRADPELIRLALSELIDNAVRFARRTVTIRADVSDDGEARVTIEDDGRGGGAVGWDGSVPHSQADGAGLGLGLALAHRIAGLCRGTIHHRSAQDTEGTRAELRLPSFGHG